MGIAKEAKKRGAHLTILNRTVKRAQLLAEKVGGIAGPLESFSEHPYDILVNCTSVFPIPADQLLEKRLVMDIITKPRETPLLAAAKKKGCETIEGIEMWIQQAVGQYCHWFL